MTSPFWGDDPNAWDTALINTFEFAECATVSGVKYVQKLDVKSADGSHGASITFKGYDPVELQLTLNLHNRDLFDLWQRARSFLLPKPGKGPPGAVDFFHPALPTVHKIYFKSVTEELKGQIYEVKLDGIEWFPAPKGNATANIKPSKAPNSLPPTVHTPTITLAQDPPLPPSKTGAADP